MGLRRVAANDPALLSLLFQDRQRTDASGVANPPRGARSPTVRHSICCDATPIGARYGDLNERQRRCSLNRAGEVRGSLTDPHLRLAIVSPAEQTAGRGDRAAVLRAKGERLVRAAAI